MTTDELNNLSERIQVMEAIATGITDANGESYFGTKWLIQYILNLDEKDIELNEALEYESIEQISTRLKNFVAEQKQAARNKKVDTLLNDTE